MHNRKKSVVQQYVWYVSLVILSIMLIAGITAILKKSKKKFIPPADARVMFDVKLDLKGDLVFDSINLLGSWKNEDMKLLYVKCRDKYLNIEDLFYPLNNWFSKTAMGTISLKYPIYIVEQDLLRLYFGPNCFEINSIWELWYGPPDKGGTLLLRDKLDRAFKYSTIYFLSIRETNPGSFLITFIEEEQPRILSIVINGTVLNETFNYSTIEQTNLIMEVNAIDPKNETLTYSVTSSDPSVTISQLTTNTFQLSIADINVSKIVQILVQVFDPKNYSDYRIIELSIIALNDPPVILDIVPSSTPIYDNSVYTFTIDAQDPNNDPLTYILTTNDTTVSINQSSGNQFTVSFPDYIGNRTVSFTATVSDGNATDTFTKSFLVIDLVVNEAPIIHALIWNETPLYDKRTYIAFINASDPNEDPLNYTLISYDPNVTITPTTEGNGYFLVSFPNYLTDTFVTFLIQVTDVYNEVALRTENVSVLNSNNPPVINNISWSSDVLYAGNSYLLYINASDLDNETLTTSISFNVSGITYVQLSWNTYNVTFPSSLTTNSITLYVNVSDSETTTSESFLVAVVALIDNDGDGYYALESGGNDCDDNDPLVIFAPDGTCDGDGDGFIDADALIFPTMVHDITALWRSSYGGLHSCAILPNSSVMCWGASSSGQTGTGYFGDVLLPTLTKNIKFVKQIATGYLHTCALLKNGSVYCWGSDSYGQVGDGGSSSYYIQYPTPVVNLSNAVQIAAGYYHSCALLANGSVMCWGYNLYGQLGDNTTTTRYSPVYVVGINNAVQIAAGYYHTCALLANGSVMCWGYNLYGQLGDNTTVNKPYPVYVVGINNAVQIAVGNYHSCALLANGSVMCWGNGYNGALGDGTTISKAYPVYVKNLNNAIFISLGTQYSCALLNNGSVMCWGVGSSGKIGNKQYLLTNYLPASVFELNSAVILASGYYHSCALLSNGSLKCWGNNYNGQLGVWNLSGAGNYFHAKHYPTKTLLNNVKKVIGFDDEFCALLINSSVYCFGEAYYGETANGLTQSASIIPNYVISNAIDIFGGPGKYCALLANSSLYCWGYNSYGSLGDGTTTNRPYPVHILDNVKKVDFGSFHTCALLNNGSVMCWGYNLYGQLGDNTTITRYSPVPVVNLNNVSDISLGGYHSCALLANGSVMCWGYDAYGQVGDNVTGNNAYPTYVVGINNAVQIAVGYYHSCALLANGSVMCWGYNANGELGDNTTVNKPYPVYVKNLNNVIKITTNKKFTSTNCALLANGSVMCWGDNANGQVGDGTAYNDKLVPVLAIGVKNATDVKLSTTHTCALLANGSMMCWGSNLYGKLGDGTITNRYTPVYVKNINNIIYMDLSSGGTCAILADNSLYCWGSNFYGEAGEGNAAYVHRPFLTKNINLGQLCRKNGLYSIPQRGWDPNALIDPNLANCTYVFSFDFNDNDPTIQ